MKTTLLRSYVYNPFVIEAASRRWLWPAFAIFAASMTVPAYAARDPFTGTWTLNHEATQGNTQTQTLTILVKGNRERYRSEMIDQHGTRQITDYVARYDEQERPSKTIIMKKEGSPEVQVGTVIVRKKDRFNRQRIWKKDGAIFRVLARTVSPDGKMMTSQIIDRTDHGDVAAGTLIFDLTDPVPQAFLPVLE